MESHDPFTVWNTAVASHLARNLTAYHSTEWSEWYGMRHSVNALLFHAVYTVYAYTAPVARENTHIFYFDRSDMLYITLTLPFYVSLSLDIEELFPNVRK